LIPERFNEELDELFYDKRYLGFPPSRHRLMLRDEQRIRQFDKALKHAAMPGSSVVDLGAGSGVLSLLACRYGASKVLAVEGGLLANFLKKIAAANSFQRRVQVLKRDLLAGPPRGLSADIIVLELLGDFGIDENIQEISAVWSRALKPGGTIVPKALTMYVRAVQSSELAEIVGFWHSRPHGFDFHPITKLAKRSPYVFWSAQCRYLSEPCVLGRVTLPAPKPIRSVSCTLRCSAQGRVSGFVGWFEAELGPTVLIKHTPRSHWSKVFFPISEELRVRKETSLRFTLRVHGLTSNGNWSWHCGQA
jgi:type I protein arginine methyltransferase